jgi:isopenicillin N synthase-like dioxygenase
MQAMALALSLPENYFADYFKADAPDAYTILRLLRYPPSNASLKEPVMGVGPHTDAGCLVMLLQDDAGGLEVQNCDGDWIKAPPMDGTYVVNIGEMLQLWSNNYFQATPHRVINTSNRIRHSAPFFLEPCLDTRVTPLTLSPELLQSMQRPEADKTTQIVYGEHILNIYQRSFKTN